MAGIKALDQKTAPDLPIDAADNLVCLFDHRSLVLSDRHDRRPEGGNIGGLRRRIA